MSDENEREESLLALANARSLLELVRLVTLPLVTLKDGDIFPNRMASGFIIPRFDRYFIVSAAHAIASDDWYIEWDAAGDGKTPAVLVPLGTSWTVFSQLSIGQQTTKSVDFAWAEVDFPKILNNVREDEKMRGKAPRVPTFYKGPLDRRADSSGVYTYCAFSRAVAEDHRTVRFVARTESVELGMMFVGENYSGLYRFRLNGKHKGHDYYRGASGAPIVDSEGGVVAILVGGAIETDELYGAPLNGYANLIGRVP